jgi:hypothetical protein
MEQIPRREASSRVFVRRLGPKASALRGPAAVSALLLFLAGGLALAAPSKKALRAPSGPRLAVRRLYPDVGGGAHPSPATAKPKRALSLKAPAPAPSLTPQAPAPPLLPSLAPPDHDLFAYRGLGAWADLYDFGKPNNATPAALVDVAAGHGVKTLFVQTGRWRLPGDLADPGDLSAFIEKSHAAGMRVVGWYVPGFADVGSDLRRSVAAAQFVTPSGQQIDGFAADIEDRQGVGGDLGRFNTGIAEYSRGLRAALPDMTLGAIVVDARNNQRAPATWAGFPWHEIAADYDVVLPMGYWSAAKPADGCGNDFDSGGWTRAVAGLSEALMQANKPLHLIGGVADCVTAGEAGAFVDAALGAGAIGGSLYDLVTTLHNPAGDQLWKDLGRFNALIPPPPPDRPAYLP